MGYTAKTLHLFGSAILSAGILTANLSSAVLAQEATVVLPAGELGLSSTPASNVSPDAPQTLITS